MYETYLTITTDSIKENIYIDFIATKVIITIHNIDSSSPQIYEKGKKTEMARELIF